MPTVSLTPWQSAAVLNPFTHFCFFGGVGLGKTMAEAIFAIFHFLNYPKLTGLIGANSHDQLSGVTLKALFYWMTEYGLEFVIDRMPPPAWTKERKFKSYLNILTVRNPRTGNISYAFIRVLSDPDALRGLEFSWYVMDESRDTPEETFDVILGRLRESKYIKGLVGTTTNGEDWVYNTFFKAAKPGDLLYGSMHVRTIEIVKIGIQTMDWYNGMARRYSPLKAAQELDAEHVNVLGGRAYYASSAKNKRTRAPWGDEFPSRDRPLVVGCDFNFSPAPCIWMVGQVGPDLYGPNGEYWGNSIHWFAEICESEISTESMTIILITRFPGFYYRVYGDCSGGVGTTSNAGITDYDQISMVMNKSNCGHSIDYFDSDDGQNPRVKKRVENMNRLLCNALGEVHQTYNPDTCPHFDDDMKYVGWKLTTGQSGRGKLSDGGNVQRTHASDGGGYACFKLFPPVSEFTRDDSYNVSSQIRSEYGLLRE